MKRIWWGQRRSLCSSWGREFSTSSAKPSRCVGKLSWLASTSTTMPFDKGDSYFVLWDLVVWGFYLGYWLYFLNYTYGVSCLALRQKYQPPHLQLHGPDADLASQRTQRTHLLSQWRPYHLWHEQLPHARERLWNRQGKHHELKQSRL